MESRLQEEALKNSGEWLGMEDANEGVAKALTRPVLRWSKDKKTKKITTAYPPNIKFKVGFWDNRWLVKAFDENKERIEDLKEGIPKGSEVIAIVKITGVNFAGGKVGYSLSLSQVKVYAPKGMPSYAFVDDEEDEQPVVSGAVNRNDGMMMMMKMLQLLLLIRWLILTMIQMMIRMMMMNWTMKRKKLLLQ